MFTTDNLLYDITMSPRDIALQAKLEVRNRSPFKKNSVHARRQSIGLKSTLRQDDSLTRVVKDVLHQQDEAERQGQLLRKNSNQSSFKQLSFLATKNSP